MNGLRIIGDTHGKMKTYAKLCRKAEKAGLHTLQLGDFNFNYKSFEHYGLSPDHHSLFGGNHDNYDLIDDCPNCIGDYGVKTLGGVEFFWMRGAFSIDQAIRTEGVSWWQREELSMSECYEALAVYEEAKPKIVIAHECPEEVTDLIGKIQGFNPTPTRTNQVLQQMFEAHQPEFWYFGHYHMDWKHTAKGVQFQCLPELAYVDVWS